MHSRLYVGSIALMAGSLAGCVQATRHSNVMVFGTDTTVGLKVGQGVNQVPQIMLAYNRQEAVIMPLLANTGEKPGSDNLLSPCTPAGTVTTQYAAVGGNNPSPAVTRTEQFNTGVSTGDGHSIAIHPCSFVGYRAEGDKVFLQDSYSVLASFGASFDSGVDPKSANASGGLAQYFATGMAAQLLALNGGAAVVAASDAAKASAQSKVTLDGKALITPTDADRAESVKLMATYETLRDALVTRVTKTEAGELSTHFTAFEKAIAGPAANIMKTCSAPDDCSQRVAGDYYLENYRRDPSKFQTAVETWTGN